MAMNLYDFLLSELRTAWVDHSCYQIYVRKQNIYVSEKTIRVICIANIVNPDRYDNFDIKNNPSSTGKFRELINEITGLSDKYGYSGIYVECVHNKFLPAKLIEYGFDNLDYQNYLKITQI